MSERLAYDRVGSVRLLDEDGRLFVARTNITKACVNEYFGREIPNAEALGLDPERKYALLRDPHELEKAVSTFNGLPVLTEHGHYGADDHRTDITAGALGTEAAFSSPYMTNSLSIWLGEAIDDIKSGAAKELSSAYRYRADMTPGEFEGTPYDGVMRDIRGQHIALVPAGRAGSDVVVADAAPAPATPTARTHSHQEITMAKNATVSRQALLASGAVRAYLRPKLAQDAKVDLTPVFRGVTAKNWKDSKPRIAAALKQAVAGKLAQDADIEDVQELLDEVVDQLDEVADKVDEAPAPAEIVEDEDAETVAKLKEAGLSDEQIATVMSICKPSVAADEGEEAEKQRKENEEQREKDTKTAMDAAIAKARRDATNDAVARVNDLHAARRAVEPVVGEVIGMDSASEVYQFALTQEGYDLTGIPATGYRAMFDQHAKRRAEASKAPAPRIAADSAGVTGLHKRFTSLSRIKVSA